MQRSRTIALAVTASALFASAPSALATNTAPGVGCPGTEVLVIKGSSSEPKCATLSTFEKSLLTKDGVRLTGAQAYSLSIGKYPVIKPSTTDPAALKASWEPQDRLYKFFEYAKRLPVATSCRYWFNQVYKYKVVQEQWRSDVVGFDDTHGYLALPLSPDGRHIVLGGAGSDRLCGDDASSNDRNEVFYGGAGHDNISAGDGDDGVYGGDGNDTIDGGRGNDTLYGDAGDDSLRGGTGVDHIYGGDGSDRLTGGEGFDANNWFDGVSDTLDCGAGYDYAVDNKFRDYDKKIGCENIIRHPTPGPTTDPGTDPGLPTFEPCETVPGPSGTTELKIDLTAAQVDGSESSTRNRGNRIPLFNVGSKTSSCQNPGSDIKNTLRGRIGIPLTDQELNDLQYNRYPSVTPSTTDPVALAKSTKRNDLLYKYFEYTKRLTPGRTLPVVTPFVSRPNCRYWYNQAMAINADGTAAYDDRGAFIGLPLSPDGSRNVIVGTKYDDVLCGDDEITPEHLRSEIFFGLDGNDRVEAGDGKDDVYGANGDDVLYGQSSNDILHGHGGNDAVFGGRGEDRVAGQEGNDKLWGGNDVDKLYGEGGDDFLNGGNAVENAGRKDGVLDVLDCGAGYDRYVDDGVFNFVFYTAETKLGCEKDLGDQDLGNARSGHGNWVKYALATIVAGGFKIICVAPSVAATIGAAHVSGHLAVGVGIVTIPVSVVACGAGAVWIWTSIAA